MKIKLIYVIFFVAAFFSGMGSMWQYKETKTKYLIEKIERELAESHKVAVDELREKEKESRELADSIGIKYYELQKKHDDIYRYNNELASQLERMQLQGTDRNGLSAGNSSSNTVNSTATTNISREDIQLLIEFAREADEAARYGMMCFEWINSK